MSSSDDKDELAEAIANGWFILPESSIRDDGAVRLPFAKRSSFFMQRGPVFSLRTILSYVVPWMIMEIVFLLIHLLVPPSFPFLGDLTWTILLPFALSLPFIYLLQGASSIDSVAQSSASATSQTKWLLRALVPSFGPFRNKKVQIIRVVTCHPSPKGGRSGDSWEVEPAVITHGLRPLDNFPFEENPVDNEMITNPNKYDRDVHKMQILRHYSPDQGDYVPEATKKTVYDAIENRRYFDIGRMRDYGTQGAAVRSFDVDQDMSDMAEEER